MPGRHRAHYRGGYAARAAQVRAAANANPNTRCARCGRTLDQHPPTRTGKPPTWDAGHVSDGQVDGDLQPEVASCNRSAGSKLSHTRRRGINPAARM